MTWLKVSFTHLRKWPADVYFLYFCRCIQRSNLRIHMRGVHKKELPRLVLTYIEYYEYYTLHHTIFCTIYGTILYWTVFGVTKWMNFRKKYYMWWISGWLWGKSAMQVLLFSIQYTIFVIFQKYLLYFLKIFVHRSLYLIFFLSKICFCNF